MADMLRLACRLGIARLRAEPGAPLNALPPEVRAALAEELRPLIERHREIWLRRVQPYPPTAFSNADRHLNTNRGACRWLR